MKILIFTTLSFIVLAGCTFDSSSPPTNRVMLLDSLNIPEYIRELDNLAVFLPGSKPKSSIRFEQEQQFGELYPVLLPPTGGFGPETAVDDHGNVNIADKGSKTIHVYSPDGSFVPSGTPGKGPGEFSRSIPAIDADSNHQFVYDFPFYSEKL